MATIPSEVEAPKEKPRADISLPKGHDLAGSINGVTIGNRMMAHLTGKIVSGSAGEYGGGSRVCIELEDATFSPAGKTKKNGSMVEDMQSSMHQRRTMSDSEDEESVEDA